MAIATNYAHVARALEFYHKEGKYFSIGRTSAWEDDGNPPVPKVTDFKLDELVALKKVDKTYMVVPDDNGTIKYRNTRWRVVEPEIFATNSSAINTGDTTIKVNSLAGIVPGGKLQVAHTYEGTILSIDTNNSSVTLDISSPIDIDTGSTIIGGALTENARHVYVECSLNYDEFPVVTYRQVGLNTLVTPNNADIIKSSEYSLSGKNEFISLGVLEVIDNRLPTHRELDQKETISLIIEF